VEKSFPGIHWGCVLGHQIIIGVVLSLIIVIKRAAYPHIAILHKVEDEDYFKNINHFKGENNASEIIFRVDAPVWFANVENVKEYIHSTIQNSNVKPKRIILDFSSVNHIDSSGIHFIEELKEKLSIDGIKLMISGSIEPVRNIFNRNDLYEKLGKNNFMPVLK